MNTIQCFIIFLCSVLIVDGQITAEASGSIGRCAVWNFPYTLLNTAAATHTINTGVTVAVDQNRNSGAIVLTGSGGMDFTGSNGITFSGAGNEITCRWDLPAGASHTLVNNNNRVDDDYPDIELGSFFTAPFSGDFIYQRGSSGWSANTSGAHLKATLWASVTFPGYISGYRLFNQDQPGTCGIAPGGTGTVAPVYKNLFAFQLTAGTKVDYRVAMARNASPCNNSTLNLTIGQAWMLYNN